MQPDRCWCSSTMLTGVTHMQRSSTDSKQTCFLIGGGAICENACHFDNPVPFRWWGADAKDVAKAAHLGGFYLRTGDGRQRAPGPLTTEERWKYDTHTHTHTHVCRHKHILHLTPDRFNLSYPTRSRISVSPNSFVTRQKKHHLEHQHCQMSVTSITLTI
jgi:hypothetical protein